MIRLAVALLVATAHPAFAEPEVDTAVAPAAHYESHRFAVAINPPLRWTGTMAASLYAGLGEHQAIRANAGVFEYTANPVGDLIDIAAGGDGDEGLYTGRTTDLGVGWMYFPHKLWDGFSVEVGVLQRFRDTKVEDDFSAAVTTRTRTTAGRALIGWSWFGADRVFLAIAIGASAGYETGTETTQPLDFQPMMSTARVHRFAASAETYMRIGVAL